jgi:N-alpha-acetyltransferase 15/16, NatA auxiliary subunit
MSCLVGLTAEEEKKAKKKAKRAQQKQEEQRKGGEWTMKQRWSPLKSRKKTAAATSTNEDKGLDLAPLKDEDPDGTKLLTSPEPLERAWKLLSPLLKLSIRDIDLWTSIYDVAVRRGVFNGN